MFLRKSKIYRSWKLHVVLFQPRDTCMLWADAEILRLSRHCNICQIFYNIIITIKITTKIKEFLHNICILKMLPLKSLLPWHVEDDSSENYLEFSFVSLHSLWSDGRKRKCKEVQVGRLHKWKGTLTGVPVNCSQSEDPFHWICFLFSEEQFRKLLTITTEMQK